MSVKRNVLYVLSGLLLNCQDPVEKNISTWEPSVGTQYFVSATSGEVISRSTLQVLASEFGEDVSPSLFKYDVQNYTLTYLTYYKGELVEASGLVTIPLGMDTAGPIVSLQHGTNFEKTDAPSVRDGIEGMELFASAGYFTLMPDYLGYGKSDSIFHPYYDRNYSAGSVIHFIRATKEFLGKEGIHFNNKLFLAGYSEGGYVTLAAAKELAENRAHDLTVTAVAAGAGGYDLPGMLREITTTTYYASPGYLAFVVMAYNKTYEWNKPLSYFFKEKYAEALSKYLNGQFSGSYINSKLTNRIEDLFNADFLQSLRSDQGSLEIKEALRNNSVAGWKTEVPVRLYHGTKDEIIPFKNSEITLQKFQDAGSINVTLTPIPGGTHGSSFAPMVREFVPWFLSQ